MSNTTTNLKEGDKVRIVRKADFPKGSYAFWDEDMTEFVGDNEVYVVQNPSYLGEAGTAELGKTPEDRDRDGIYGWLWPVASLELVAD